jgi:hypothetical protein
MAASGTEATMVMMDTGMDMNTNIMESMDMDTTGTPTGTTTGTTTKHLFRSLV